MKLNMKIISIITIMALLFSMFPSSIFADSMAVSGVLVSKTTTQAIFSGSASVSNAGRYRAGFAYSSTNSAPSKTDSSCTMEQSFDVSTSGGALSIDNKTASGLSSGVGYYVRAYVYDNASGAIQYSSTFNFTTDAGNVLPNVSTSSANYDNGYIEAWGNVDSAQPIIERGFVYSSSNSRPTLSDRNYTAGSGTGSFRGSLSVSQNNQYYYVRAYATNSTGTAYGSTITLEVDKNQRPSVTTERIYNVDDYSVDVEIYISDNSGDISECGVVYSSNDSTPSLSSSSHRTISAKTGSGTVHLNNLSSNTTYYVRAFARNDSGTSYGEMKSFTTDTTSGNGSGNYSVYNPETSDVKDITATTAVVTGYVDKRERDDYTIHERGFAYSSISSLPTIHDSSTYDTGDYSGTYSKKLTNLQPDTTYYVRAYVTYGQSVYYGDVITFKTSRTNNNATVTIHYRTVDDATVGNQRISARMGDTLTSASLQLPYGYVMSESNWSYTVIGDAETPILVKLNTHGEMPFMPGVGNYEFKPNAPITRQEVAIILYNLSDKKMTGTPATFGDISGDHEKYAIDYVSAQKYMVGDDGNFYPQNSLTRAEMADILCKFNNLSGSATAEYSDVSPSFWATPYIALVSEKGIMRGYPDGTFQPEKPLTRAEACTLFSIQEKRSLVPLDSRDFEDVPVSFWAYRYIMNAAIATP